ncbi:MAG: class I SAM-dependent rRNA methyltransferase [Anaerolineae bacterium]|nr:class I SAM-dependent rRNA methyltransferase [Anaerolineae bacterium]MDQ7034558.1 class I SAM-dependent rRNA methyltransferase [Anaerolineae bacterium]
MSEGMITIRKGREKPIRNQHPWIFSGSIAKAENADDGDIVTVVNHRGDFLARGYWNHKSQIQVRILTWQDEPIDEAWWRKMLKRAIYNRGKTYFMENDDTEPHAYRVVNAENDFLPGLIVDRYGDWLVLQALTLHIDKQKHFIANLLADMLKIKGVYERSDVDVRGKEGLKSEAGLLWGEEPPEHIAIYEAPFRYYVDVRNGHKTGFYLDQSTNRSIVYDVMNHYEPEGLREDKATCRLLNLFSYTGAFIPPVAEWRGIVSKNVDTSADALALAQKNYELNGLHEKKYDNQAEFIQVDVFDYLRECVEKGEQYDIVILDPPKFAHNKRQVDKAARGYKDINLNAFKVVKSGGYLMTFSCSGAISRDLFQKIVFGALADSGRQAQIIKHLSASDDHPIALTFPEGEYLKGLLLRVY